MANRDCNGKLFKADGVTYYECLWDGKVIAGVDTSLNCPNCNRTIDASHIGDVTTKLIKVALFPDGRKIHLPST